MVGLRHLKPSSILPFGLKRVRSYPTPCSRFSGPFASKQHCFGMSVNSTQPATKTEFYKHGLKSLSAGIKMEGALPQLSNFREAEYSASKFVKPKSVYFQQDGVERKWDLIESHDSIAVVLYHTEMNALLIVRQFRPAVYATEQRKTSQEGKSDPPFSVGFTYELCAGLVDKDGLSLAEVAHEEILEECGYNVPPANLLEVTSFVSSVGTAGTNQTMFYGEVDESMRVTDGGGTALDGERIELLALPVEMVEPFIFDTSLPKSTGMMFGMMWLKEKLAAQDRD